MTQRQGLAWVMSLRLLERDYGGGPEAIARLLLSRPAPEAFSSRWLYSRGGIRDVGCGATKAELDPVGVHSVLQRMVRCGGRPARAALLLARSVVCILSGRCEWDFPCVIPDALQRQRAVILALDPAAVRMCRNFKAPIVYNEQCKGGYSREFKTLLPDWAGLVVERLRRLECAAISTADHVVFPSRGARDLFRDWHPECATRLQDAEIIYNGVPDPGLGQPAPLVTQLLVNVAAHVPDKQVDLFVRAVGLFRAAGGGSCQAINYGPPDPAVGKIAAPLRLAAKAAGVQLGGFVPHEETMRAIRQCWVFITCPSCAVFDLALIEAMAAGRPVVATPVGGNLEALGEDYPLYASTEREMRDRLLQLRDTPGMWAALSERNRSRFLTHFTLEAMGQAYTAALVRMAEGGTHPKAVVAASGLEPLA